MEQAKNSNRFLDGLGNLGMKIVEEKCPWNADAQLGQGLSSAAAKSRTGASMLAGSAGS